MHHSKLDTKFENRDTILKSDIILENVSGAQFCTIFLRKTGRMEHNFERLIELKKFKMYRRCIENVIMFVIHSI